MEAIQPLTVTFRPYGRAHYFETIGELTTTLTPAKG